MRYAELVIGAILGAALAISVVLVARWLDFTADFALGVTAGIVSSAVVALLLGIIRAPHLVLEVAEHADGNYNHGNFRFVHVRVRNLQLRLVGWRLRRPATFCRAEISFGDIGANVPRFRIDGRWASLPEPVQQYPGGMVLDQASIFCRPREFINPGDDVALDVAIKQDGVNNCFGFNNRSYLSANWSNPLWSLPTGTYWVQVRIEAAEVEAVRVFYLVNNGNQRAGLNLHETLP